MLDRGELRERLRAIVRSRRGAGVAGDGVVVAETPPRVAPAPTCVSTGVEEFLPGGEWHGRHGTVYVHERPRSSVERPRAHWGRLGEPPIGEIELASLAASGLARTL